MVAYYNENDPYMVDYLRFLVADGKIAYGDVDQRSITDVTAEHLEPYTQCHFFAGVGGWSAALRLANWDDRRPVWTGSCPCQPFSSAGNKKGQDDPRHLWPVWFNLIKECRPAIVFGEQVEKAIIYGWADNVRYDLESQDYAFGNASLQTWFEDKKMEGQRYWFVAQTEMYDDSRNTGEFSGKDELKALTRQEKWISESTRTSYLGNSEHIVCPDGSTLPVKPGIPLLVDEFPEGVALQRAFGNAIDPALAAYFIEAAI